MTEQTGAAGRSRQGERAKGPAESEVEEGEFQGFRFRRDSKEDLEWRMGLSGQWRAGGENSGRP